MGLITYQGLSVVQRHHGGLKIEAYANELEMVLEVMDSGYIGGGLCYGDIQHRLALLKIERKIAQVRQKIANHNAEEGLGV